MNTKLKENIKSCKQIFKNCDIDYEELRSKEINDSFFEDYQNVRIVNSFLFNFAKLQDKIGSKLFKDVLYELKEIDDLSLPMIDVLNTLERLHIVDAVREWDGLREIRDTLSHEYPFDTKERVENINLALEGYLKLKKIFERLADATQQ